MSENSVPVETAQARPLPGHKYWGYIVYRCTYGDDAAWSAFIDHLREEARYDVKYVGHEEMMDSLNFAVRDDPSLFQGASKAFVRQHFKAWTRSAAADEELDSSVPNAQPIMLDDEGVTTRYEYCLYIDDDSLYSIIDKDTKLPKTASAGHVNIIKASWAVPTDPEEIQEMYEEHGADDPGGEGEEPVEGCTMRDIGWMKADTAGLMPEMYSKLIDM